MNNITSKQVLMHNVFTLSFQDMLRFNNLKLLYQVLCWDRIQFYHLSCLGKPMFSLHNMFTLSFLCMLSFCNLRLPFQVLWWERMQWMLPLFVSWTSHCGCSTWSLALPCLCWEEDRIRCIFSFRGSRINMGCQRSRGVKCWWYGYDKVPLFELLGLDCLLCYYFN